MPVAKPETSDARIIAHVDMDCFYVQVEQRKRPELRGIPTGVVQYNSWKGGALIAVGYEARKYGVKRSMRGAEAKQVCPQIQLVQVPVARGKADLNAYRNAGSEVVDVLARKGRCERASIDEVYLDLTEAAEAMLAGSPLEDLEVIEEEALKSHILGLHHEDGSDPKENVRKWLCRSDADHRDKLLACGVLIVAELRIQVLKETEFTCSAGIAHNKMLAKLASGMNKPAQQTVVPHSSVRGLLDSLPIKKMKQLGGKLGSSLQSGLGINTVGDLLQFSEEKLQERYGINTGTWLWNIARGMNGEDVKGRLLPNSHGSGKTFPGPQALKTIASVQHWLNELCEELSERLCSDLDQNKRMARTLTLHARAFKIGDSDSENKFPSKSCPLRYGTSKIQEDALNLFQAGLREYLGSFRVKTLGSQCSAWGITSLSVSASKIVAIPSGTNSIAKYFHGHLHSGSVSKQSKEDITQEAQLASLNGVDSLSGPNLTRLEIEFPQEETLTNDDMPVLDSDQWEQKRNRKTDQVLLSSSTNEVEGGFSQETSLLSTTGTESPCRVNETEAVKHISEVEATNKHPMPMPEQQENKSSRPKKKAQVTPSILDFFHGCDRGCSLQQEHLETLYSAQSSTSGRNQQANDGWRYKIDEIDTSIIGELPAEIQQEVWDWLQPQKRPNVVEPGSSRRPNIVKPGSSITHYFLPSRSK